jgi:outer membrane usher protein PapC
MTVICIKKSKMRKITFILMCGLGVPALANQNVQFNTDVLDLADQKNVNLEQFSKVGYIMPGQYRMVLRVNQREVPELDVTLLSWGK